REEIKVQKKALELAEELLLETHEKVKVGRLPPLDEKQAESQVESVRTALFAAEQAYTQQQDILKNLLTDAYQAWIDVEIEPTESLLAVAEAANRTESWINALSKRPDLLQTRLDVEKQGIDLRYHYNQLFPSFNLVGGYGWHAVEPTFSES